MTSGDAPWRSISRCCWKKGLMVCARKSGTSLAHQPDGAGRFTWRAILKAIDIVLVAVSEHIERFAAWRVKWPRPKLAKAVAMSCWDSRKLRSYRPPTAADFLAGAQLCYFIQLILQIESNGHSVFLVVWTSICTRIIVATLNSTDAGSRTRHRDAA